MDYKLCVKCNKNRKLMGNFLIRKTKSGGIVYGDICKRCRVDKELERRNSSASRQKIRLPNISNKDHPCSACKFLKDCNYRVKILKSLDSPYCFIDSRYHFMFVREYGKNNNMMLEVQEVLYYEEL